VKLDQRGDVLEVTSMWSRRSIVWLRPLRLLPNNDVCAIAVVHGAECCLRNWYFSSISSEGTCLGWQREHGEMLNGSEIHPRFR